MFSWALSCIPSLPGPLLSFPRHSSVFFSSPLFSPHHLPSCLRSSPLLPSPLLSSHLISSPLLAPFLPSSALFSPTLSPLVPDPLLSSPRRSPRLLSPPLLSSPLLSSPLLTLSEQPWPRSTGRKHNPKLTRTVDNRAGDGRRGKERKGKRTNSLPHRMIFRGEAGRRQEETAKLCPVYGSSVEFRGVSVGSVGFHGFRGVPWRVPWRVPWSSVEDDLRM